METSSEIRNNDNMLPSEIRLKAGFFYNWKCWTLSISFTFHSEDFINMLKYPI